MGARAATSPTPWALAGRATSAAARPVSAIRELDPRAPSVSSRFPLSSRSAVRTAYPPACDQCSAGAGVAPALRRQRAAKPMTNAPQSAPSASIWLEPLRRRAAQNARRTTTAAEQLPTVSSPKGQIIFKFRNLRASPAVLVQRTTTALKGGVPSPPSANPNARRGPTAKIPSTSARPKSAANPSSARRTTTVHISQSAARTTDAFA